MEAVRFIVTRWYVGLLIAVSIGALLDFVSVHPFLRFLIVAGFVIWHLLYDPFKRPSE